MTQTKMPHTSSLSRCFLFELDYKNSTKRSDFIFVKLYYTKHLHETETADGLNGLWQQVALLEQISFIGYRRKKKWQWKNERKRSTKRYSTKKCVFFCSVFFESYRNRDKDRRVDDHWAKRSLLSMTAAVDLHSQSICMGSRATGQSGDRMLDGQSVTWWQLCGKGPYVWQPDRCVLSVVSQFLL